MTSREAINKLRKLNKTQDKKEYYDAIEKDLEVLEILGTFIDCVGYGDNNLVKITCYDSKAKEWAERIKNEHK